MHLSTPLSFFNSFWRCLYNFFFFVRYVFITFTVCLRLESWWFALVFKKLGFNVHLSLELIILMSLNVDYLNLYSLYVSHLGFYSTIFFSVFSEYIIFSMILYIVYLHNLFFLVLLKVNIYSESLKRNMNQWSELCFLIFFNKNYGIAQNFTLTCNFRIRERFVS